MNKTEMIAEASKKLGIDAETCEKVLNAFEDQFGDTLANKFKGVKNNREVMLTGIAEKTGVSKEDSEKIIDMFENVFDKGLSDKLRFKK